MYKGTETKSAEQRKTIYSWAFRLGKTLFACLERKYGDAERARKQMKTFILNLRSEALPERFRRTLLDFIIEVAPECEESIGIPREIKEEKPWRVDEFYRYSTAILSGLYEAVFGRIEGEGGGESA